MAQLPALLAAISESTAAFEALGLPVYDMITEHRVDPSTWIARPFVARVVSESFRSDHARAETPRGAIRLGRLLAESR